MIALASDILVFRLASGESLPCCADMISAEMLGDTADLFDPEFVRHAAKAVFHYFKHELGRKTVTVGEFAGAMEKVLRGFSLSARKPAQETEAGVVESDLRQLAGECGESCELFFFPRLRAELRQHLQQAPRVLRFRGLRSCVKRLTGAQRWTPRCRRLEDGIVEYLRECLSAEGGQGKLALVVD